MQITNETRERARAVIEGRIGLSFPRSREIDLDDGLIRAARECSLAAVEELLDRLHRAATGDPEWESLIRHVTVGETCFFRYPASYRVIEENVLSPLIAQRRARGYKFLRLWSAGSASGEEAYSLAILVRRLLPDYADWNVTILATDINPAVLDAARRAVYRPWALREMSEAVRTQYLTPRGPHGFEVAPEIRDMVSFEHHNLADADDAIATRDPASMDLVLCRNVLIYFSPAAQRKAAARLRSALLPEGWLLTTPAEASLEIFHPLRPIIVQDALLFRPSGLEANVTPRWQLEAKVVPEYVPQDGGEIENPWPAAAFPKPAPDPGPPAIISAASTPPEPPSAMKTPVEIASLDRASLLADQGRLDAARSACEAVLARDRTLPEPYRLLAAICEEMGDLDAAVAALQSMIFLAPESLHAHFLLGRLFLRRGAVADARRCMQTVIRMLDRQPTAREPTAPDGVGVRRLRETAEAQLASMAGEQGAMP